MSINNAPGNMQVEEMDSVQDVSRRRFFQVAGGIAGAGLLLSAASSCRRTAGSNTYVGTGDTGLLNTLYIIQQVEAAFYTQAVATPYYGLTVSESTLLTDLRDQEIAHREFYKNILSRDAVKSVTMDFSAVTFADRSSVLKHAAIIEDISVAAINGMVKLFSSTSVLVYVSKMATVEARHAAYMHDLQLDNSFADATTVDTSGLGMALAPLTAMTMIAAYTQTKYDTTKLPTY